MKAVSEFIVVALHFFETHFTADSYKADDWTVPDLSMVLKLRKNAHDNTEARQELFLCWENYVSHTTGRSVFRKLAYKMRLSTFVTASDEAFTYLVMINNWSRWNDMAKTNKKTTAVCSRYTRSQDHNGRYGGWSQEGIKAYNILIRKVKKDRNSDIGQQVEDMVSFFMFVSGPPVHW